MGLLAKNINMAGKFRGTFPQVPTPSPAPAPSPSGIVTAGLILNLDAGNSASYSGTGTTWTDLSGNGNNATLLNGPVYNSTFGGYFRFDGSNDYAPTTSGITIGVGQSRTIEIVFQKLGSGGPLLYHNRSSSPHGFSGVTASTYFNFETVSSFSPPYTFTVSHPTVLQNSIWYHGIVSVTIPSSPGTMSANIGLNGNFQQRSTNIATDAAATNYILEVARFRNNTFGTSYGNANVAIVRVYNRALTSSELSQNYNAIRNRFGV